LSYGWVFWPSADWTTMVLAFGCEVHTLAEWREQLSAIVAKHVPHNASTGTTKLEEYERAISLLLDYASAIRMIGLADGKLT
jgi:hypothetical protein